MRRDLIDFSGDWQFEGNTVRLPHNAVDLPLTYFDETSYQRQFTYEKRFVADPAWAEHEIAIIFDGAMADTIVRLNGEIIAQHRDGYTPFEARLTGLLRDGENVLSVTIDGSENPEIPPFGGQIDYLTYAGIYRPVWLRVTAPVFYLQRQGRNARCAGGAQECPADSADRQSAAIGGFGPPCCAAGG